MLKKGMKMARIGENENGELIKRITFTFNSFNSEYQRVVKRLRVKKEHFFEVFS